MRAYEPKIEVRLVKVVNRQEISPGVAAVMDRYRNNYGFELTPFLGEHGGVRLSKGVREPAGAFTLTLADMRHPGLEESLYGLIEPMDMIEFRLAHDPVDYAKPEKGYALPVVMRGLVSSVSRGESLQGGKPVRTLTLSGQDFGKILQIIQIFYLNNSVVGDNLLSELAFFQKYATTEQAKIKPAAVFVAEVVQNIVAPYLARMLASSRAEDVGAQAIDHWNVEASIAGSLSPYAIASINNVSLHQMLTSLLDVGPFNELFVRDDPDGVTLVARPSPVRTPDGAWIQTDAAGNPATAEFVEVWSDDVVSINLSRTDAGVANYYWADNTRWTLMHNETARRSAMSGPESDFVMYDYPNAAASLYGVRKMEVQVTLGHPDYSNSDGPKKELLPGETNLLGAWLHDRRRVLAAINKDNIVFEHGTLRIRGNEAIKAGMYVRLSRGVGLVESEYYVSRVDHDVQPFAGFFTTLTVERGTSFINRAQAVLPIYGREIDADGLL